MMNDIIREKFEDITLRSFAGDDGCVYDYQNEKRIWSRKPNGEYVSGNVEDHWQTFQEGWLAAIEYLTNKTNSCYSDLVSDGGMDPR